MTLRYGHDENGLSKQLENGRVLRIQERPFNTILTLSQNLASPFWLQGW